MKTTKYRICILMDGRRSYMTFGSDLEPMSWVSSPAAATTFDRATALQAAKNLDQQIDLYGGRDRALVVPCTGGVEISR